ncbi:hypothetical protein D915_006263 [Fasciola hepatica]|uniref:Uncharacterized protein n=1 Tax=Fasciola hepatica TaxID=6192 RepID=A0A2H1C6E3_FASHE|nr:hypothetical protein D915_006263 [Fasciola hepatica]
MQTWNTTDYVTKKFAVRECPIILAQLLNTSRVRFALLQTNCYLDVQSRVLNWRHRATPWTKGAIVEVVGPNYSSIDHCNDLIESLVPFYATRRPYVEITSCRMLRCFGKRSANEIREKRRASSSMPAPDLYGSGESVSQKNTIKYSTFLRDPPADPQTSDHTSNEKESGRIRTKSPIIVPRVPRSRALSCHTQSAEEYVDRNALQTEEQFAAKYSARQESDVKISAPEPGGDELPLTLEQNKHNATGTVELGPNLTTDPFPLRALKPMSVEKNGTFPRPKLFESERSARLAIHSQKAAAVRASLQKMKEDKYRRFPSAMAYKSPRQNTSMMVNRLMKSRSTRATTPKALGDHAGRLPIYSTSGTDEKMLQTPSPEIRDLHISCSWDRLSGTMKPQPLVYSSKMVPVPFTGTPKVSPNIRNILNRTHADIIEDRLARNSQTVKSEAATTEIPVTGASQPNIETDSSVRTTKRKPLARTTTDTTKGMVFTSDMQVRDSVPFSAPHPVVNGVLNKHPRTDKPSCSQNFSGPYPVLQDPDVCTASSSCSPHVLSATPVFANEPEYTECKLHTPNSPGECQLDCTNCTPLNVAHSTGKILTDTAEYRRKTHYRAQKASIQPEPSLSSEFSNLESRLNSLHIPASAVSKPHTIYDSQSLPNESTEVAPNQPLSSASVSPPYGQSCSVIGTKIKLGDLSSVKPTIHPLITSFSANPNIRPRLFERIDFCSRETTETQDVLESDLYVRPLEIDLGQLPRRTEIRMEEPPTGDAVEDYLMVPNTDGEPSNDILSSALVCGSADPKSKSMKESVRKKEQNPLDDQIVDSLSDKGKFTESQQKHADSVSNQLSNLEDRQIPTSIKTTAADNSGRQHVGDSVLPVSPGHSPRTPKEIETIPLREPVNRFLSKGKPICERTNSDCIGKGISQKRPIVKSVMPRRINGSRPISKLAVGKGTTITRAGSLGRTNGAKPRQAVKSQPRFSSGTRITGDLVIPDRRVSQSACKAIESSIGDSAAMISSSLPKPSVTTPCLPKHREAKIKTLDNQPAVHGSLGSSAGLIGHVETPQVGLSLGASISTDRIPSAASAASSGIFAGYCSPGSSHGYENVGGHPTNRSQTTSHTENTSTVETSESLTETTETDDSGDSSTVLVSNDETSYPTPESKDRARYFAAIEAIKLTRESGRPQPVSAFTGKKRSSTQFDSREFYRARNNGKRKTRNSISAESRAERTSHVMGKRRFRSSSVYNKILRCLPLQWCFGNN